MATIDEILAAMPEPAAEGDHDYLVIDPASRTISVPESEAVFGVTGDELADRKYFLCPRFVGDGLDLSGMFIRVNYRNANGEEDGYLVNDVAITADGDYITFSWQLTAKVVAYMGAVQFGVCADLPNTTGRKMPDWNTAMASGDVLQGLHPDLGDVEGETSDVVTQLRAEITAGTAAVEACGAEQIQAVKNAAAAETADAVAAIQAQGEATRASIPADYSAMAATVDTLTRDRATAIVCQAEGTAIQVQDASNDPLQGLRIFGKSTQDGTPTPDNPVEIVSLPAPVVGVYGKNLIPPTADTFTGQGITSSPADAGTVTLNGAATAEMSRVVAKGINLAPGRYTLSVHGLNNEDTNHDRVFMAGANGAVLVNYVMTDKPATFTLTEATTAQVAVVFAAGSTYSNATVDVQLELGDAATDYEPYTGQTLALQIDLPGIPVSSGGNYTDADGQQWICDEVDLARGVYVQRVRNLVFSGEETFDNTWYPVAIYHIHSPAPHVNITHNLVRSSHFNNVSCGNTLGTSVAFGNLDKLGFASSDDLTAYFAEQYAQNNPVTVQYVIATPIETALTDAEVQAFRALHSRKPVTTVLNDAGAHMALEYAADPKTYIDNKLAALVAANN